MAFPVRWRYRTTVLGLCMAVYFGARFGQAALTTLAPSIVDSLGITMGLFGLAITGLSLASALVQFPSGLLGDRYGERALLLGATALTGLGTALLAAALTYLAFLPLVAAVGVGSGLYYSPASALLHRLYDDVGRTIGVFRVSGQAAGVVAPAVAGVVATLHGWRVAVLAGGLVLLPVFAGLVAFMEPTPAANPGAAIREAASPGRLAGLLSRSGIAGTTALASVLQFVDVAAFTFVPAVLQDHHGLAPAVAGGLYAAYFATVALVQPVAGWLSDRVGRDPVTAATLLVGVVGFGLLARPAPFPVLAAGVVLAGVSMTWPTPVQSRLLDALGEGERGVGFGLVRTVYLLVGALGGYAIGTVVTAAGWTPAFLGVAGLLGGCAVGLVGAGLLRRA